MNYLYIFCICLMAGSAMLMCWLGFTQIFSNHVIILNFNDIGEGNIEAVIGFIGLITIPFVFWKSIKDEAGK